MSHEPEPIDADLLAALRAAAPLTEVPGDVRARVLEAVEGRITALPGPGGGRGGGFWAGIILGNLLGGGWGGGGGSGGFGGGGSSGGGGFGGFGGGDAGGGGASSSW